MGNQMARKNQTIDLVIYMIVNSVDLFFRILLGNRTIKCCWKNTLKGIIEMGRQEKRA